MSSPGKGGPEYAGRLFVVEGGDGSGKSTQVYLLKKWLESQGYGVFLTEWNSSRLVRESTRRAKRNNLLTPTTFSLIHASDFADRYEKMILPQLQAGYIVLADRYVYTAYARDCARGCDPVWVRHIYSFAVKPTRAFYFRVPANVAVERIVSARTTPSYYEAGMDLGLSMDPVESFRIFQRMVSEQYDSMAEQEELYVIDGTRDVKDQQDELRREVAKHLVGFKTPPLRPDLSGCAG